MSIELWRHASGECYTQAQIRERHPLTVFPHPFPAHPLDDYTPVTDDPAPAFDPLTHELVRGEPVQGEGGAWHRPANVRALPADVAAANIAAARRARVPATVTRRQARQALLLAGLLDSVPAALAAIPDPTRRKLAQIEWEDSQGFERGRPLLISLAHALGLDDEALDQLFISAAAL